jgi:hypothetical protein
MLRFQFPGPRLLASGADTSFALHAGVPVVYQVLSDLFPTIQIAIRRKTLLRH